MPAPTHTHTVVGFSASSFSVLEGEPGVPHSIMVCLTISTTAFSGEFTLTTQQGTAIGEQRG